jgi:hypothetical protein
VRAFTRKEASGHDVPAPADIGSETIVYDLAAVATGLQFEAGRHDSPHCPDMNLPSIGREAKYNVFSLHAALMMS